MHRSTAVAIYAVGLATIAGAVAAIVWGPGMFLLLWTAPEPDAAPPVNSAEAVELVTQDGPPPVEPQTELMPLPDYQKARRYFSIALDADHGPAYFIENWSGAHAMGFALVDCKGRPLVRPEDIDDIGGDRIDVVQSSHHGYHDLVCIGVDGGGVDYYVWQFDGVRYVTRREGRAADKEEYQAMLDGEFGGMLAFWCSDIFSLPPGRLEAKIHPPTDK